MVKLSAETKSAVPHGSLKTEAVSTTTQKLSELLEHGHAFTKALGGTLVYLGKQIGGNGISHAAETGKHAAHIVSDLAHDRKRLTRAGWIGAKMGKAGGLLLLAENPLALAMMACEAYEEGHQVIKAMKTYLHPSDRSNNHDSSEPFIDLYQEPKSGEQEAAIEFNLTPTPESPPVHINLHDRVKLHRGGKNHRPILHTRVT